MSYDMKHDRINTKKHNGTYMVPETDLQSTSYDLHIYKYEELEGL